MSYSVNLDYTATGRVEVKIQVIANNHDQALKTAQNILNHQKTWYRKHKDEVKADQEFYKKILQYGPGYVERCEEEDEDTLKINGGGEEEEETNQSKFLYPPSKQRTGLRTRGVF